MAETSEHPAERGLSPLNPLDSEVCGGSSYPLSFPSQPPDVRNWFSSYEYESPECSGPAQDLHSFVLPAGGGEIQGPLGTSRKKAEVPSTDKHLAESPLILVPEVIPSKENPNLLPKVLRKSSGKHDDTENADSNLNLLRVDEKLVEGHEQSPKWIPAKTECEEHVSHQQNSREIGPISPKIDTDLEVAYEVPGGEELLPRCNVGKEGFISVKTKDNTSGSGETFPSSLSFRVKYEDPIAGEETVIWGMPSHGKKYCSDRENHKLSPCHELFQENGFLPLKRKQNLQQLFGFGFLTKYSEEENNDLISSKMSKSPVGDPECSPKVLSEMSECKENLGAEDWRREDNTSSAGKIKEDQISQEKCSFLRCTKEELNENAPTSGFVSTKNKEITPDVSCNLPPKSISAMKYRGIAFSNGMIRRETNEHLMNGDCKFLENNGKLGWKEAQDRKRNPLADKTNFQAGIVAMAPELPGKWRCPRRSKPYMGPQLKQLRLERWVHRAT
uniref:Uncharacterized protein LOC105043878 isoform X2 n=1 Tax=Elaeis guineensis var. tenera TaxID=51953 RepID=A0A6J0PH94_ELAGV|nr:uncharacterized protein LOC105043878 isoform X2 [Elaeis guineensis]